MSNAKAACRWMINHKDQYDRFILMRFDYKYRLRITSWPKWDLSGIFLVNKDSHKWETERFYADMLFIVDKDWVDVFADALTNPKFRGGMCLHHCGRELECRGVDFHLMYEGFYRGIKNPFYTCQCFESEEPNIDVYYEGEQA